MGTLFRPALLPIPAHAARFRTRAILLARAAVLYRGLACGAGPADAADRAIAALHVRCHALAWRHFGADAARSAAAAAYTHYCGLHPAAPPEYPEALLTHALAAGAGIGPARELVARTWGRMELYGAPAGAPLPCAALLAAYEACGEPRYLRRAEALCRDAVALMCAAPAQAMAWALLLLRLAGHPVALAGPADWLLPCARRLFDAALAAGLDGAFGPHADALAGGAFGPLADALAVAGRLAASTDDDRYCAAHDAIWRHCWRLCPATASHAAAHLVLQAVDG